MKSWFGIARLLSLVIFLNVAGFAAAQSNSDLICQVAAGVRPAALADSYGIRLVERTPGAPFARFSVPSDFEPQLEALMSYDPRVVWYELTDDVANPEFGTRSKGVVIPAISDPDALYAQNLGLLDQINWSPTLASQATRRVRVAVLDTGLSPYATTLWSNVVATHNCVDLDQPAYDLPNAAFPLGATENVGLGHGTMVTGLIAQLAPNADLIIERVADSSGQAKVWNVIRGLADAVNRNAELCNVSLGTQEELYGFKQVMSWTNSQGAIVVAPAGNDGLPTSCSPASLPKVICVTGLLPDDEKAPFSNWDSRAVSSAPATGVKSVWWTGEIGIWSGTSFSAPLVTGALALTYGEMTLGWNVRTAKSHLESTGRKLDLLNPDYAGKLGPALDVRALMQSVWGANP